MIPLDHELVVAGAVWLATTFLLLGHVIRRFQSGYYLFEFGTLSPILFCVVGLGGAVVSFSLRLSPTEIPPLLPLWNLVFSVSLFTVAIALVVQAKPAESGVSARDLEKILYEVRRTSERNELMLPEYLERRFNLLSIEVADATRDALTQEIIPRLAAPQQVQAVPTMLEGRADDAGKGAISAQAVMDELSHAMNTPLSRIEAVLLGIRSSPAEEGSTKSQDTLSASALKSVTTSLEICKAVLGAYSELVSLAGTGRNWAPESLRSAVHAAIEVYAAKAEKSIQSRVRLPETIGGLSNNYALALLLPILENGVEASAPHSWLSVAGRETPSGVILTVSNTTTTEPNLDRMHEDGFSTKPGHSGRGLSMVRRLLAAHRGASISYSLENGVLSCEIRLPARDR